MGEQEKVELLRLWRNRLEQEKVESLRLWRNRLEERNARLTRRYERLVEALRHYAENAPTLAERRQAEELLALRESACPNCGTLLWHADGCPEAKRTGEPVILCPPEHKKQLEAEETSAS